MEAQYLSALQAVHDELRTLRDYHEAHGWNSTTTAQHVLEALRIIEAAIPD